MHKELYECMDNEIMKRNSFPVADGHIESILIGCDDVKVSFQSWNAKKIVIIFRNCCGVNRNL